VSPLTRRFHIPSALQRSSFRLDVETALALIVNGALLIDVRRQDDPSAALADAVRIAPDEVPGRLSEFPRDVPIVLACT
jgi:rhodanese-related sulfurtransferase